MIQPFRKQMDVCCARAWVTLHVSRDIMAAGELVRAARGGEKGGGVTGSYSVGYSGVEAGAYP